MAVTIDSVIQFPYGSVCALPYRTLPYGIKSMNRLAIQNWIDEAFRAFAIGGVDSVRVERVAQRRLHGIAALHSPPVVYPPLLAQPQP